MKLLLAICILILSSCGSGDEGSYSTVEIKGHTYIKYDPALAYKFGLAHSGNCKCNIPKIISDTVYIEIK
jgi:hypothetical protein